MRIVTKEIQGLLGGEDIPRLASRSLRMEKYVDLDIVGRKDTKRKEIEAMVQCPALPIPAESCFDRVPGNRFTLYRLCARMIVNQAGGILENAGICIHRHFGYPYIPGSAVKGCARHYAWQLWKDLKDNHREEEALAAGLKLALTFGYPTGDRRGLDLCLAFQRNDLFGDSGSLQTYAGGVVFFPAHPSGNTPLGVDIVNCHHAKYYAGKNPKATEDEDPIPNFFPVIESGALFDFTLAPVQRSLQWALQMSGLSSFQPILFAEECLSQALRQNGIGAKTAAGYGWFQREEAATRQKEKRVQERKSRKEEERAESERQENLKRMPPEDRRVDELEKLGLENLKAEIRKLGELSEFDQKCVLRTILEKFPDYWKEEKKAKPGKKAWERAENIRKTAELRGVKLP